MRVLVIFLFVYGYFLHAQSSAERFIKRFAKTAVSEMEKYKIPASITLAQGMLESNYGNSRLSNKANNYFGVKCHNSWKGKRIYHDDDKKGECFRKYPSPWWSFRDHSKFLQSKRYNLLYEYDIKDYKSWAKGLKRAGYATNPDYSSLLINKIEQYQLWRYDNMTLSTVEQMLPEVLAASFNLEKSHDMVIAPIETTKQKQIAQIQIAQKEPDHRIYKHKTGHLSYIVAKEGDTWDGIAQEFDIKIKKLVEYNDVALDRAVTPGQYIFFKRKKSRAKQKYYVAQAGDNMYLIAQRYGIRLSKLYEKNRMRIGEQPTVGQKVYLRNKKRR